LIFAFRSPMLEGVPSSSCRVSFTDGNGVTHSVVVSAASLFEAAALAVAEFRRCSFAAATVGPATRLLVAVETPATTHELTMAKLQYWLDGDGKTPREQAVKVKLRQLLVAG
jgi:type VI protein secretion system component VasA